MKHLIETHGLGYPRIGERRELKKAVEAYWKGDLSREGLELVGRELRAKHWAAQAAAGLDLIPCGDFSFYDQVLDVSCLVGNIPERFGWEKGEADVDVAFAVARGKREEACGCGGEHGKAGFASEMTKWFDTNYHYLVPEFSAATKFRLASRKIFEEFAEAQALGYRAKPVLLGPVSYLLLGKVQDGGSRWDYFEGLLAVYENVVRNLAAQGAEWIQFDEPILATDVDAVAREFLAKAYARLKAAAGETRLLVANYFGELRENLEEFLNLPVDALHVDAVRGGSELEAILAGIGEEKILSLGVVDGRNVWRNDYEKSLKILRRAQEKLGASRVWVSSSCSLLHVPVALRQEEKLDGELKSWLAFAEEKLEEIVQINGLLRGRGVGAWLEENQARLRGRAASPRTLNPLVRERLAGVQAGDDQRKSPFAERQRAQREFLKLPEFPTTTIGSFPQTAEVRKARAQWKKGVLSDETYQELMREKIHECVKFQEEIGLDVLVHGEFERNDMVEAFGELLDGFAFSEFGWVQSYGSRCVKPPLIFGDVSRPREMTVSWAVYAQSLTEKWMKGMLTGPITILQWSFVRDDQSRETTARQIALAIRDEVVDLERAGIRVIQIDEPAIREGLPLRREDWDAYLRWAVECFRLSASGVEDETQIHTHMCYSEFNDMIEAIAAMDADVITIETSRSQMELLDAFVNFAYPNEIGPGVYDIHSPRVPTKGEMLGLLRKALALIPRENLWVNPDCGLKTRGWPETKAALALMVEAARELRADSANLREA